MPASFKPNCTKQLNLIIHLNHEQTFADRTKPWMSFQHWKWLFVCQALIMYSTNTAKLRIENLNQTTFRFSPIRYHTQRLFSPISSCDIPHYLLIWFHFNAARPHPPFKLSFCGMNKIISAASRMSVSQADVTCKKCFIVFPQKRIKLTWIFHQTYNGSVMLSRENILQRMFRLKIFHQTL